MTVWLLKHLLFTTLPPPWGKVVPALTPLKTKENESGRQNKDESTREENDDCDNSCGPRPLVRRVTSGL